MRIADCLAVKGESSRWRVTGSNSNFTTRPLTRESLSTSHDPYSNHFQDHRKFYSKKMPSMINFSVSYVTSTFSLETSHRCMPYVSVFNAGVSSKTGLTD